MRDKLINVTAAKYQYSDFNNKFPETTVNEYEDRQLM
jgi:hypothetical protein